MFLLLESASTYPDGCRATALWTVCAFVHRPTRPAHAKCRRLAGSSRVVRRPSPLWPRSVAREIRLCAKPSGCYTQRTAVACAYVFRNARHVVLQTLRSRAYRVGFVVLSCLYADCFCAPPSAQEIYSLLLRKHLIPRFGGHRLCDISRVEVQQYLLEKLKQGFAWETTNHLRHLLSKVMGTAVNWDYVPNNPVRGVKMPERTLKRPHRFLTAEEVRRLIAASKEPIHTIVLLATMTGLRIGEILALRWGRVDLLRGTLLVAETCYKGHFGSPKTRASKREVPLAPAVVRELKACYSRSAERSPSALVFATNHGAPLAADNRRKKALRTACKRAGLQRIDWHTLRHTHGTLLHSQGTPLKVAQAQLGHSHMATTLDVYTHASVTAQRDAGSQMFPSWRMVRKPRRKKLS